MWLGEKKKLRAFVKAKARPVDWLGFFLILWKTCHTFLETVWEIGAALHEALNIFTSGNYCHVHVPAFRVDLISKHQKKTTSFKCIKTYFLFWFGCLISHTTISSSSSSSSSWNRHDQMNNIINPQKPSGSCYLLLLYSFIFSGQCVIIIDSSDLILLR